MCRTSYMGTDARRTDIQRVAIALRDPVAIQAEKLLETFNQLISIKALGTATILSARGEAMSSFQTYRKQQAIHGRV